VSSGSGAALGQLEDEVSGVSDEAPPVAGSSRTGSGWRPAGRVGGLERGEARLYRFASLDREHPVRSRPAIGAGYLARVTVAPITSALRGVPSGVALEIEQGDRCREPEEHRTARSPVRDDPRTFA
jgi:hypothetical protein